MFSSLSWLFPYCSGLLGIYNGILALDLQHLLLSILLEAYGPAESENTD